MLRPFNKITFTSATDGAIIVFDFVNNVEISSSYETLTDTATIKIPKRVNLDGRPISEGENSIFKRGDRVKIELGYFPNLITVFEGYIRTVNAKSPIIIECDDEMFTLKNTIIDKYSGLSPTLTEFLDDIVPSTIERKETIGVTMGTLKFSNLSVCDILDIIKKDYGIYSYFVNKVLHVGFASDASDTKEVSYTFEENIIEEQDLVFQREQDVKLRIKAISMNLDNSKTEVIVGDSNGALRTHHYYNATEVNLRKFANLKLNRLKYTGFKGDLLTFGEPYVRHGDRAKLISFKYPEKNGTYQVISVVRSLAVDTGYKQRIELGIKLA